MGLIVGGVVGDGLLVGLDGAVTGADELGDRFGPHVVMPPAFGDVPGRPCRQRRLVQRDGARTARWRGVRHDQGQRSETPNTAVSSATTRPARGAVASL